MRGSSLKSFLVTVAALGLAVPLATQAAISVGAAGSAVLTFDALPAVGDFSTLTVAGASGDAYDPDVDIQTHAAATINTVLGMSATVPISANALARWHSTLHFLMTPPTGVRYTVLMATLMNDSGANQPKLVINYTLGANDAAGTTRVEEAPGHSVYYSLDGTTWTRITALNSAAPPGDIGAKSADVTLTSPWLAGSTMYVLWLDDNAVADRNNAGNEEGGYTIDDLQFLFSVVMPQIVSGPAPTTTVDERGTLTLSVVQSGGTSVQWFKGATALANGTSCVDGHDRTVSGATTTTLTISGVTPGDAGTTYHCEVSNSAGTATSPNGSVTVTADAVAPTLLYATCGSNPNEFIIIFSEQLNDSCAGIGGGGAVTDISNWTVDEVGGAGSLGVMNFTNTAALQNGQTVLGLITSAAHDPTKPVRISWTSDFTDAAATPHTLPAGSAMALCFESSTPLLPLTTHTWRVDDSGTDLGTTWKDTGFVDSGWPKSGTGLFDGKRTAAGNPPTTPWCRATVGGQPVNSCINISNDLVGGPQITTVYLRTHFNVSGSAAGAVLRLHTYLDDGAVFWLNGQELTRIGMASGPVVYGTLANVTIGDAAEAVLDVPAPSLVSGDNVMAVEVHEVNLTSSDITMGLQLNQLTSTPALTVTITQDTVGGTVTVSWSGGTSAGTLRSTTSITTPRPWPVVAGSPVSPYTTTPTGPQRFYEVSDP